jgi:hypothetical protein
MKRAISPALFALVAACFFLPFFSVSCNAEAAAGAFPGAANIPSIEATGTGFDIIADQPFEPTEETRQQLGVQAGQLTEQGSPDYGVARFLLIGAAAAAVLGLLLSLLPGRAGPIAAIIAGVAGPVLLFLTQSQLKSRITDAFSEGAGGLPIPGPTATPGGLPGGGELAQQLAANLFEVSPLIGFWLAMVGFAAAAIWGIVHLILESRRPAVGPPPASGFGPPMPPPTGPPPGPPPPSQPPPAGPPPAGPPTRPQPPPSQPPG